MVSYSCPYIPDGRRTRLELEHIDEHNSEHFGLLLAQGYRRSGSDFYRNLCENCNKCIPIRVPVKRYTPNKGTRRTIRRNSDIRLEALQRPVIDEPKIELFTKYQMQHHHRDREFFFGILLDLYAGYPTIREFDYYLGDRLIAVGILDEAGDSVSTNYFFYDPDEMDRRLGYFSMAKEIEYATAMGKEFYYLGFYVAEDHKMSYKIDIHPNQLLIDGVWKDFRD